MEKVIIIGAGHAGGRCALQLRSKGYPGKIELYGNESSPPYERPPLSKNVLTGEAGFEKCLLRPIEHYKEENIALNLGNAVTNIDRSQRKIMLSDGSKHEYDKLILATGATLRMLSCPGSELENVFVLRTIEHCDAIKRQLANKKDIVIIGGGFIGLEVAASARKLDCNVTVIEAADRLLGRVFPPKISALIQTLHEDEGVTFQCGELVDSLGGETQIESVRTQSGLELKADCVLVGIGVTPAIELAEQAGLEIENGIFANQFCQTSDPDIYAIGDCANALNIRYNKHIRLEAWQNAEHQAEVVANHLSGNEAAWQSTPWFWSDQFRWNIQMTGTLSSELQLVSRGEIKDGKVLYFLLDSQKQLVGAISIAEGSSGAKDLRVTQMLIENGCSPSAELLGDESINLKKLLKD